MQFLFKNISLFTILLTAPAQRTPSNAFWEVLTPTRHHSRNPNPLQMEIHYGSNQEHTKATILLNNMRVICVMDLILAVKDFLLDYDDKMVPGAGKLNLILWTTGYLTIFLIG